MSVFCFTDIWEFSTGDLIKMYKQVAHSSHNGARIIFSMLNAELETHDEVHDRMVKLKWILEFICQKCFYSGWFHMTLECRDTKL